ncbi:hypothetical protein CSG_17320 [Campylobacter fetus subsp. venerealis str. 84-112]|nr:hypothetical protein CSG_17320 [Campylobacter fetus subsp. venerealis str. 84-112]
MVLFFKAYFFSSLIFCSDIEPHSPIKNVGVFAFLSAVFSESIKILPSVFLADYIKNYLL